MGNDRTRPVRDKRRSRSARRVFLVATALIAMAAFLVGTPFVFLAVGNVRRNDWAQFSNIGQAYGGAAAVFGTLTLVGIVVSLILQSRESAANRESVQRTIHNQLLGMALDDPALRACWGPSAYGNDEHDRQHTYANMIVSFWRSMFEIGKLTEDQLRALSGSMLAGAPGRRYWSIAGPWQKAYYTTDRDRRFVQILDEEYAKAKPAASVPRTSKARKARRRQVEGTSNRAAVAIGLVSGTLMAGTISMIRCRTSSRPTLSPPC